MPSTRNAGYLWRCWQFITRFPLWLANMLTADRKVRNIIYFLLGLMPIIFGLLSIVLGQDSNWDLRNYHWYNAHAFLNGRLDFDMVPAQTPTFYNPTIDLPLYLIADKIPTRAAGFVLGLVHGLNF